MSATKDSLTAPFRSEPNSFVLHESPPPQRAAIPNLAEAAAEAADRRADEEAFQPSTRRRASLVRTFGPLSVNGLRHTMLTLVGTALGGGVLSVSYVLRMSGLGLGVLMILTGGLLSLISIKVLMQMSVETGKTTYAGLLAHCAGPRAGPILDLTLFVYGLGSCTGYLVFLADFLPPLVRLLAPQAPVWCAYRGTAITACVVLLLPWTLQTDISAIRFLSPVSICALLYNAVVITVKAFGLYKQNLRKPGFGEIEYFKVDWNFCNAFALCVFAFNCHLNVVPSAGSMIRPTRERIDKVSRGVNTLQFCFYTVIGVSGYLSFLDKTPQDILTLYSTTDPFVAVGRAFLVGAMLVAVVLNMHPTIRSGLQFGCYVSGQEAPFSPTASPSVSPLSSPRSGRMIVTQPHAWSSWAALTLPSVLIVAFLAWKAQGVADILSILGATVATAMVMVLPAYCMHVVMEKTFKNIAQQVVLLLFACISAASVPIKFFL